MWKVNKQDEICWILFRKHSQHPKPLSLGQQSDIQLSTTNLLSSSSCECVLSVAVALGRDNDMINDVISRL